jgi:hypothetical protein
LATHTYRDMPFLLTPVIWQKLSHVFRRTSQLKERAHGDGLAINEDSVEAFEEVVWKKYFPAHYQEHGIKCWPDAASHQEFEAFFKAHMQKIILLRRADASNNPRYISKNNANIARIEYLQTLFPDAFVVVPVRHPVEQAISLLRQHQNFIKQHAEDTFARKYMADIGHFEFGELHRAILFPGLAELTQGLTPDSLDYWIAYWIVAYRELSRRGHIFFLSFENLCVNTESSLHKLVKHLELPANKESIKKAAGTFKPAASRWQDGYTARQELVDQAMECYESLLKNDPLRA